MAIADRVRSAWNAFTNTSVHVEENLNWSAPVVSTTASPSRPTLRFFNDKSIVSAIYNRISIDVAGVHYKHIILDEQGRYKEDKDSHLNECFTLEPNIDQGPRAFRQDIVMTLFDKGVAALVPVDTAKNPNTNEIFDIYTLRVGEIVKWYPKHVRVSVYNEAKGKREEVTLEKRYVAIVENPLYSVMNEPNGTLQRLIRKLGLLDSVDEAAGSGKLDLIIQLPYVIKSDARRAQAEKRREDIEFQLRQSQYGIAYTDGTEKITQLNRPAENNLLKQIEYLTAMLYGQLGITEEVMNGTADEKTMINYFNRTIEPIVDAIIEAQQRAFLGPAATKTGERILYFLNPFRLLSLAEIAEVADKFTRNEVLSANEIRGFMGIAPAKDPKADELRNSNMPQPEVPVVEETGLDVDLELDSLTKEIETLAERLG